MHRRTLLRIAKKFPRIPAGLTNRPHSLPIVLAHIAQWYHAVSNTTRIGLLEFLSQRERCVSELQQILDIPQSTVSFHLKVLRNSGLVAERVEGRWKYYRIRGETLDMIVEFTRSVGPGKHVGTCFLACCRDS